MTETKLRISDLRIGNWVEGEFVTGREPFQIIILRESDDCSGLYPIPLNSELLEKAGFKTDGNIYLIPNNPDYEDWMSFSDATTHDFCFNQYDGEWNLLNGCGLDEYRLGKPFIYLHQLQNLFHSLTGEELQISL